MKSLASKYNAFNFKELLASALLSLSLNASALDAQQAAEEIKSRVVNKAISETESYINRRANEFVNNFGKGRTEISIQGIDSTKPSYSLETIQPISEFNEGIKDLTFLQGSIFNGQNEGEQRNTINLGIGQRYLVEDEKAIAGINLFYDQESDSGHKRASLGLEYKRSNFSITANKYHPLSDKKIINGYTEEALEGHDVNLTGAMPYTPWAKIKGTHYYWDQIKGDNISGTVLGVEIELSPSTTLEVGTQNSNTMQRSSYGKLSVKLPVDNKDRMTNFVFSDAMFQPEADMDLTLLEMIKRSKKIQIEKALNGVSVTMGIFNATTVGATCELKTSAGASVLDTSGSRTSGTTNTSGLATFSNVIIPTGLMVMTCTGGSYTDESTGATVNPAPTTHLTHNYTGGNLSMIAYASPLSEIAYQLANADGDLSDIETQSAKVASAFGLDGIDINAVKPTDLNNEAAGNDAAGKVGLALAAVAQMGTTDGKTPAAMITALKEEINSNGGKLKPNRVSSAVRTLKASGQGASANAGNSSAAEESIKGNTVEGKGVTLSVSSINVPEEGTTTYTVVLDAEPSGNVVITPASSATGVVTVSGALTFTTSNWWTAQTVTITGVSDADSTHETATISHSVTGSDYAAITAGNIAATMLDDEALTIADIANATVNENAAYTSVTPSVSNAVGTVSYALSGTDATDFSINTSTGVVSMVARNFESPADADTNNVYNITITATDTGNANNTVTDSWTVTVADVVEAASFTIGSIANATTAENAAYSVTPSLSGDTPIGTVTYTLAVTGTKTDNSTESSAGKFDLTQANGKVTATGSGFDYESYTSHSITLTATDADGNTDSESWTVTVTDVNETFASGDTFNGKVYLTVTSPDTGRVWLDRNLGASQVCTSSTDSACYGDLYQWGRATDGHESRTSTNTSTLATTITPGSNTFITNVTSPHNWTTADSDGSSRTSAWADGGSNDICPAGFSVPTEAELTADTISATTTDITNSATAFSSFLKIPVAGYHSPVGGGLEVVGSFAFLWSRSANGSNSGFLDVNSSQGQFSNNSRANALSVRCIKD